MAINTKSLPIIDTKIKHHHPYYEYYTIHQPGNDKRHLIMQVQHPHSQIAVSEWTKAYREIVSVIDSGATTEIQATKVMTSIYNLAFLTNIGSFNERYDRQRLAETTSEEIVDLMITPPVITDINIDILDFENLNEITEGDVIDLTYSVTGGRNELIAISSNVNVVSIPDGTTKINAKRPGEATILFFHAFNHELRKVAKIRVIDKQQIRRIR